MFPSPLKRLSTNAKDVLRDGPKRRGLLRTIGKTPAIISVEPLALRSRRLLGGVSKGAVGENRRPLKWTA
jgi:hypothetical protein